MSKVISLKKNLIEGKQIGIALKELKSLWVEHNYELSEKQVLKTHSKRKIPCKAVDVKNQEEKNVKNPKKSQSKSLQKVCKKVCKKYAKLEKTNFDICCNYCKINFTHRNSLYKHKRHLRCEKMPKYEMKR